MTASIQAPSFVAPVDVTRTPVDGSLAARLAEGATTAALTFAGQGWAWWTDLAELLARRPWLRSRAQRWAELVESIASRDEVRDLGATAWHFDPLGWIDDPTSAPSDGELAALPLSMPGALLTQLLAYREAWEDALAGAVPAGTITAATGHSGGLLAASVVAADPHGVESDDVVRAHAELAVLLGHLVAASPHAVAPPALEVDDPAELPTPMVAVTGVRLDRLEALLDRLHPREAGPAEQVRVVLRHGPYRAVLAGLPEPLRAARHALEAWAADHPARPKVTFEPLAVSAPCHHPVLEPVARDLVERLRRRGVTIPEPSNGIALVGPSGPELLATGHARSGNGHRRDLLEALVATLLTRAGSWDRTGLALVGAGELGGERPRPAEWVLDLGPGDGIARLTRAALRGTGARLLALSRHEDRRLLVTAGAVPEQPEPTYAELAPRPVQLPDGSTHVENRFTLATGRSPMVLPGMTPTTADAPIVAAAANAGFLAELAGGGQVTEEVFTERLAELRDLLDDGQEVVFNALHLDPYLWSLHLGRQRLVQAARRAGAPLCGVTVSAGIPPRDEAVALLDELAGLGMWCNAFKPGTSSQVRQVVEIAHAAPHHTVFVHLEGGAAGGHHSWEELEDLLLAGYHDLRAAENVVLCVGGGIGTPERAADLLTGRWSVRHTGVPMPVDAVLLGTVAMATAEATATPGVKRALVEARGRADQGTGDGLVPPGEVAGGITSGRSGLDADIHFLDNAASRCARLLDEVAGDAAAVQARRDEIVEALAATAKPYFGDVASMTYEQLLRRYVELTALGRHGRYEDGAWLDVSHRRRFLDLLRRAEGRLHPQQSGRIETRFPDDASVDDPTAAVDRLVEAHPHAATTVLHPADPAHFLAVCRRPGKPVPFVPVLDADVRRWYQSDALWQAQHPAYDADQVLVIPGPEAVGGIDRSDEPVAELLGRFERHLLDELVQRAEPEPVDRRRRGPVTASLRGPVAALLEQPTVLTSRGVVPNPVLRLGRAEEWEATVGGDGQLTGCTLAAQDPAGRGELARLELGDDDPTAVDLVLSFPALTPHGGRPASHGGTDELRLRFHHRRLPGADTLVLDEGHRDEAHTRLLEQVLLHGSGRRVELGEHAEAHVTGGAARRRAVARTVGHDGTLPDGWLPTIWPTVFSVLGAPAVATELLSLVHLEHAVTAHRRGAAAGDGTRLEVRSRVRRVAVDDAGTRIEVRSTVHAPDGELVTADDTFLLRDVELGGIPDELATGAEGDAAGDEPGVRERPRLTLGTRTVTAPRSMDAFAAISGDHNPIHRSTLVARLAGLEQPIVHGAWTSATCQRVVAELAAGGDGERIAAWRCDFLAPLLPGESVEAGVARTGVVDGREVIDCTATVERDGTRIPVLRARAEVAPPRTAYLFPGQGIQRQGMGMDGYARSAAARDVWDRADRHTRERLGFSILSIVRDNPTSVVADGATHRHPAGVLHLTQFTQVAMAALASAQVAELREAGVFDEHAICAGHSVGEYNALAAVGGVLDLEVVVELVFRRGQAMHHLVPRDDAGRSDYRLAVVRPHVVGMDHAAIDRLVRDLGERLGATLEIVNHNLRGKQYAVAGTVTALAALERELSSLAEPGAKPALLYVPGIDVPFHSTVLRDGVAEFRRHLDAGLPERIDPEVLVGRYVPNLVPRLFTLERSFVEEVRDEVGSESLTAVLDEWDDWSADPGRLCRELLVELLAWQFASPVRWIETQDLLLDHVERVVEIGLGSQPTVANLMKGTIALEPERHRHVEVRNVEADRPVVLALEEDPPLDEHVADEPSADEPATDEPAGPPPAEVAAPAQASTAVADLPLGAADGLRLLLAHVLGVRPDQLAGSDTIDDLVDGVSSRRNQVLMDLGAELSVAGVDGANELPLDTLAHHLGERASRYRFPGPVLRDVLDARLPAVLAPRRLTVTQVTDRVREHWGLGDGWAQRTLVALAFETRDGDSARGGALARLADLPADGAGAIDAALALVAADAGTALPSPQQSAAASTVDSAALTELEARILGPDGVLAGVARDLLEQVAPGDHDAQVEPDPAAAAQLARLEAEHGARRAAAVAPRFDQRRHVQFSSWWATARHDVVRLHHDGLRGDQDPAVLDEEAARLSRHVGDRAVRASAERFRRAASERGDAAAAARFERLLEGSGWSPPVPATRPGLEVVDGARRPVELDATDARIEDVLGSLARGAGEWRDAYVTRLRALRGDGGRHEPDCFADEVALVTGASPGSIGYEVVRRLLAGGATVVCTTSDDSPERLAQYRELYAGCGSPGAELHVVRANLASFADVDALVEWIVHPVVDTSSGVSRTVKDPWRPTLVVPFAAGGVSGELPDVGPDAEVAARVLLWGVERLVGRLVDAADRHGSGGRALRVLLPLSPNHGTFGGDGPYGEAKAALEVLLNRWSSEHRRWGRRVELVAPRIGWVRGTNLMDANDALAALVERDLGVRTWSASEMGWLLAGLCAREVGHPDGTPLRVDLTGGLGAVEDLRGRLQPLLEELTAPVDADPEAPAAEPVRVPALLDAPRADDPSPDPDWIGSLRTPSRTLEDMVVVVGAAEVGPWGGSATRFDLEVHDELSPASVAELAWICGLVRWEDTPEGGTWVDVATGDTVAEHELAARYRDEVHERCGIRTLDQDGPLDPEGITLFAEVHLDRDVVVPVSGEDEARAFAAADPEHSQVRRSRDGGWEVVRRAGSTIRLPRRVELSRRVGAQVPAGFDPTRWGIPTEMAASVDRLSLWNLVATVEAFLDAGIEPEELLAHVHPARVGNTQGSGMGGMASIQRLYRDAVLGGPHPNDLLQEGLGNVIAAYVVQGYVGGYGPMVHPVAACATAAVSIEEAVDKIRTGRADVVVAGGWDDLGVEGVLGFGEMSATADTDRMEAAGLHPHQFSRANDRRRGGFVEGQGGGTLLLARGSVAAALGLPVRGVVVHASSHADGIQTSIPAPGMGALACALGGRSSPLATALAEHGLEPDDLAVVSKHDTSTTANDPNESELHHRIATALGRSEGNPLLTVSQKTVTGHAKGGAAAWQAIGLLQVLETGEVPGNRNLECLDESHRPHTHLVYGHRSLRCGEPLLAGLLTSLGFGHVSAVVCLAHRAVFDAALLAAGGPAALEQHRARSAQRRAHGDRRRLEGRYGGESAYTKRVDRRLGDPSGAREAEARLLTDPDVRLTAQGTYAPATGEGR